MRIVNNVMNIALNRPVMHNPLGTQVSRKNLHLVTIGTFCSFIPILVLLHLAFLLPLTPASFAICYPCNTLSAPFKLLKVPLIYYHSKSKMFSPNVPALCKAACLGLCCALPEVASHKACPKKNLDF